MLLRSLSIAVPGLVSGRNGKGCPNNCKFCVSALDRNHYQDCISLRTMPDYIIYEKEYIKRINFCIDRNFESMVITGTGEPIMNMDFIQRLAQLNKNAIRPFKWIDLQTSGAGLTSKKMYLLKNYCGVTGISLSLSSIFHDTVNDSVCDIPEGLQFNIVCLCRQIKEFGFNLRLSLNMWDHYCEKSFDDIFSRAKELEADQLTFRMLYKSGDSNLPQNKWIDEHRYPDEKKEELDNYIKCNGIKLETVSFGAVRYAIQGMSILVDSDCMNQHPSDDVRYLILRPNCKLYTKWNEPGSLLF